MDLSDRVVRPALRAEPVGARVEIRLEDRLQHQLQGRLRGAVPRSRDPRADAACRPALGSMIRSRAGSLALTVCVVEIFPQVREKTRDVGDVGRCDTVDVLPGPLAPVAPDPAPCHHEHGRVADEVLADHQPAARITDRPLVQLGGIAVPAPRPLQASATAHRYSPVSSCPSARRCQTAAALPHVTGSPGLGVLRRLRHAPAPSMSDAPAGRRPGRPHPPAVPERFPRSPRPGRRGRCPALPLQHRHAVRRGLPRWPPGRRLHTTRESPASRRAWTPRPGPYPPGLSRRISEALHAGSSRTPSRLARPARAIWQSQPVRPLSRLLPPSPASPGSGCRQLHHPAATRRR